MSETQKPFSDRDYQQVLRASFNDTDKSLSIASFITAKIGRKITQTTDTTTVPNDTLIYDFLEDSISLYSLKMIFTDGTQTTMLSVERIS